MLIAELPIDEELRLEDLASYDIMDTVEETEFSELVELAAQICKSPISLISLLDKNRQWFKAKKGLAANETSKDVAFCAHAILQEKVMEVPDATKDIRFFDNPLVTGELGIRFYAGAPIVSPEGHKLGTVCIIDTVPRNLLPDEERALTILSNQVSKLLELRKKNILIRQRAEEAIAVKSKVIKTVIQQKENDKRAIAYRLHEDLAQSMASGIMFLNMSVENKSNNDASEHFKTAKQQFSNVLTGIRNLSYDITPSSIDWIPAEELIKEFIEKVADTFLFEMKLKVVGSNSNCSGEKAVVAIRVIEQWLKVLSNRKEVTRVNITIKANKNFELLIEDNGPVISFETRRKEVFESIAFDMAKSQQGAIDISVLPTAKNLFKLTFPVTAVAVA